MRVRFRTVPYSQAVRLHRSLTDAGVVNKLYSVPEGKHGPECCTFAQQTTAYTWTRDVLTRAHVLRVAVCQEQRAGGV